MIGSNDFCLFLCTNPSLTETLQNHERDIVETLRILRDNIPRVFVSLIPPPQLKVLVKNRIEGKPSIWCDILTDLECPCLFGLRYRDKIQEYYDAIRRSVPQSLSFSLFLPQFLPICKCVICI